jgi:ABC-type glycerol-3-phosphate transport system substrate-binding protein
MSRHALRTRSELPWLAAVVVVVLGGWHLYNRHVLRIYPQDASEGGRFHVITYGSDPNPARADQLNKFNQYHRKDGLKVALVPAGSQANAVTTTSAAHTAPDIIDVYTPEDIRTYIRKGIALPLNEHLKANHVDLEAITWPSRLDELRVPNPAWKPGDHPLDRHIYYCVPNNMDVHMVFFNRSLYTRVKDERERAGLRMPREPWLNWTWWDYALLAKAMHRRGPSGHFISFGGGEPDFETLHHQIGDSQRGESRAAFERLDADARRRLGVEGLSWDDCVAAYSPAPGGGWIPFPNRVATEQALQYQHDLVAVIKGVPSPSDANQMATTGGFAANATYGQFKAGLLGMHISGRWFLGQVRADCAFDWRLLRMPRWVPLEEWERWQREGREPGERDGEWGEREHPLRGFSLPLGGRMAFISSSSRDPAKAFTFLQYLISNQDFNRILLVDDGMGADMRLARDYLSAPDPLFPEEAVNRPVEHELGTLTRLYARDPWPYTNRLLARDQAFADMSASFGQGQVLARALAISGERIVYHGMQDFFPDQVASTPGVGRALAPLLIAKLQDGLAAGAAIDAPAAVSGPSALTLLVLGTLAAALVALTRTAWRERRRQGAAHE